MVRGFITTKVLMILKDSSSQFELRDGPIKTMPVIGDAPTVYFNANAEAITNAFLEGPSAFDFNPRPVFVNEVGASRPPYATFENSWRLGRIFEKKTNAFANTGPEDTTYTPKIIMNSAVGTSCNFSAMLTSIMLTSSFPVRLLPSDLRKSRSKGFLRQRTYIFGLVACGSYISWSWRCYCGIIRR